MAVEPKQQVYFDNNPDRLKPLSLRVQPHLDAAKLSMERVEITVPPLTPPWMLETPEVNLWLTDFEKSDTNDAVYLSLFNELSSRYKDFYKIFTDGSKSSDKVGAASAAGVEFEKVFKTGMPSCSSIYSAELQALILALKMVYQSKRKNFLILSDSLSSLTSIKERKLDHPFLLDFFEYYKMLCEEGKRVVLAWVPSHVGIRGNTAADTAAKDALSSEVPDDLKTKFSDLKANTHKYVKELWQIEWDKTPGNKLHKLQPIVSDSLPRGTKTRKE